MSTRFQLLRGDVGLRAIALAGMLALSGCSNLSGLGGGSKYACKAPEGVACDSVSGTYANALHNNLPSQRQQQSTETPMPSEPPQSTAPPRVPLAAAPAVATTSTLTPPDHGANPLRSQARVLRLWTKPWEDADGDLYDQGYVYVQVSTGQWLIDHVQRQIREAYTPLRPPPKTAEATGNLNQGTGGTTEPSDTLRTTPAQISPPLFGRPSVGMPAATSFNRTQ
ncbi:MAG: type IV conjugative transfer system lipoprotein TraV [Hydrogenophaga sp.]|uniref:type IV conjugative transfer system lipoprotein TraV n=1 Tax=Hydrogenophaga sp. TaxID=1904254 RepID=UPI00276C40BB|nr:type IV conjugative transfer system lipoprotein TraV [Hydrogenophaga sp.]MDP3324934.1 type IV conjugative transfer system lipoprotein TraV [Hydrogenophaga sp.]MDZ4177447.1 type IV conjugative transfer system lipoprotein TraV [Hydrogenophaga sp.]